jgi:hypothetical protein
MMVVCAGLSAASVAPAASPVVSSQLSAAAIGPGPLTLPVPTCGPNMPTCPHVALGQ